MDMTTNTNTALTDLVAAFFAARNNMKKAERGQRNPTVASMRYWEQMCKIAAEAAAMGMGFEFTQAVLPSTGELPA